MKPGTNLYARYKTNSKRKNSQLNQMRYIKIVKEPHYNKRYKKGLIVRAKDLSDIGNSTIVKTFYLDKLEIIDDKTPDEGIPPSE